MERLRKLFEEWAGEPLQESLALGGGGSSRRYYRLFGGTRSCIGTIADDLRENEAFFAYSRHLRSKGMHVPEVYAIDSDRRHYIQEDLGDRSLYGILYEKKRNGGGFDAEMLDLYKQALSDLNDIQKAGRDMDFNVAFPRADFDRRSMMWDLNYFKYYFVKLSHVPFDEELLENDFEALCDFLLQTDTSYFMYRDFQGRNILVGDCMNYIDYQGGRRGAAQYDVASLLYSAKSDLPETIRQELLRHYVALHGDADFMTHFWGYVLIRIMQTLGAYGFRGYYERKPYFLESIPLALANLRHVTESHLLPICLPELERVWRALANMQKPEEASDGRLTVSVRSFSYKRGIPEDTSGNGGGHVFDCRALPNPGRYAEYKNYTGKDRPVIDYLRREPAVDFFLDHAKAIVAQSVDKYHERHFTHLSVNFGCTGGQHRSVYCTEQMGEWLRQTYPDVNVQVEHTVFPNQRNSR